MFRLPSCSQFTKRIRAAPSAPKSIGLPSGPLTISPGPRINVAGGWTGGIVRVVGGLLPVPGEPVPDGKPMVPGGRLPVRGQLVPDGTISTGDVPDSDQATFGGGGAA